MTMRMAMMLRVMSMIAGVVLIVVLKLLCDCDVVGCGELLCCVGY